MSKKISSKIIGNDYFNLGLSLLLFLCIIMIFIYLYYNIEGFNKNKNKNNNNNNNNNNTIDFTHNNLFLYWEGHEYKLIKKLRELIYLHSKKGDGYTVHLITPKNLKNYVSELPKCFDDLLPAHKADYIRVYIISKYGGIWLDSDVLVLDKLDELFNIIKNKDGFFIKENNTHLWNGVFGSKPNTSFMKEWLNNINYVLEQKKSDISWTEIGNHIQKNIEDTHPDFLNNYHIFNGLDNMYPVNWDYCVEEFLLKQYDNYKNLIRDFQPIVILCNSVYKEYENDKYENDNKTPLTYFINKSIKNANR